MASEPVSKRPRKLARAFAAQRAKTERLNVPCHVGAPVDIQFTFTVKAAPEITSEIGAKCKSDVTISIFGHVAYRRVEPLGSVEADGSKAEVKPRLERDCFLTHAACVY